MEALYLHAAFDARVSPFNLREGVEGEALLKVAAVGLCGSDLHYYKDGGIGGAIAEFVVQNHPVPMKLMGIDSFAPTGSATFLLEHFGLTADSIVASARELLKHGK